MSSGEAKEENGGVGGGGLGRFVGREEWGSEGGGELDDDIVTCGSEEFNNLHSFGYMHASGDMHAGRERA